MPAAQDQRARRAVAVPAARGGAAADELRAAEADPDAQEPDAHHRDAAQRPPARGGEVHTILEDTGIKLGASRPTSWPSPAGTCSTRWWPARLIVLADLARGQLRKKIPRCARRSSVAFGAERCPGYRADPAQPALQAVEEQIAPFRPPA